MPPVTTAPSAPLHSARSHDEGSDDPARDQGAPQWVSEVRHALRTASDDPFRVTATTQLSSGIVAVLLWRDRS